MSSCEKGRFINAIFYILSRFLLTRRHETPMLKSLSEATRSTVKSHCIALLTTFSLNPSSRPRGLWHQFRCYRAGLPCRRTCKRNNQLCATYVHLSRFWTRFFNDFLFTAADKFHTLANTRSTVHPHSLCW